MSSLVDIILKALEEFLRDLFSPVSRFVQQNSQGLIDATVSTNHPNAVFSQPTNGPWPEIYSYYWDTIVPLALLLWALSIGLVILFESTSYLFSSYHRSKLKRRAFSGLLGILAWWWMAAISLRFMDALAGFITPNLSEVPFFDTVTFAGLGVLGLVLTLATDLVLFVLIGMIYFVRQIALNLYVLMMPLLIVFWIPGVGPFTLVSRFMKQLAGFYVPFLFMTLPVAMLFRLTGLMGEGTTLGMEGFGAWLTAIVIPLIALVSPFILFWQAGALFFMGDRAAHRLSTRRARDRVSRAAARGQGAVSAGRDAASSLRAGTRPETGSTGDGAPHRGSRARLAGASSRVSQRSAGDLRSAAGTTDDLGGLRDSSSSGLDSSHTDDPPPYLQ